MRTSSRFTPPPQELTQSVATSLSRTTRMRSTTAMPTTVTTRRTTTTQRRPAKLSTTTTTTKASTTTNNNVEQVQTVKDLLDFTTSGVLPKKLTTPSKVMQQGNIDAEELAFLNSLVSNSWVW